MNRLYLGFALLLAFISAPAAALDLPARPQGPIYDEANLLPPAEEAAIDQRLRELNARTGNAVIVATVDSLQGETIETYAVKLYETWGIGGAERDTGVLLLIAPNERKMRIEVGYGLTPYITDILSARIIRDEITPRFKAGDMTGGIEAGVDALVTQLEMSPEDAKAIAEAAAAAEKNRSSNGDGFPIGLIVWFVFLMIFVILPMLFRLRGRRYRGSSGTIGNILLWTALNAASNHHRGSSGWGSGGGGFGGGGGGGFGGFGGGMSGGGGASGGW